MASMVSGCEIWKMAGQANNTLVELPDQWAMLYALLHACACRPCFVTEYVHCDKYMR